MKLYPTGEIKQELDAINGKPIYSEAWSCWRKAAGVQGHKCTHEQWIKLCAAFALYKSKRKVNSFSISKYIRDNGDDPMAFLPGLFPIGVKAEIPGSCFGADLPDLLFQWFGITRKEGMIAIYCKNAGLEYGRRVEYKTPAIKLILQQCAISISRKRIVALQNLKPKQKQVA